MPRKKCRVVTTFAGQRVSRRPITRGASLGPAMQRLLRSLNSLGVIMADSAQAARSLESAHTPAARSAVLDRFAADTTRDADRSAA